MWDIANRWTILELWHSYKLFQSNDTDHYMAFIRRTWKICLRILTRRDIQFDLSIVAWLQRLPFSHFFRWNGKMCQRNRWIHLKSTRINCSASVGHVLLSFNAQQDNALLSTQFGSSACNTSELLAKQLKLLRSFTPKLIVCCYRATMCLQLNQ